MAAKKTSAKKVPAEKAPEVQFPDKLTPEQEEFQRLRLMQAVEALAQFSRDWYEHARRLKYVSMRGWNRTCAVDGGVHFYWNPEFVSMLTDKQLNFVVVHEVYHIKFKHPWRGQVYIHQMPDDLDVKNSITKHLATQKNVLRWGVAIDLTIHASLVPQIENRYSDFLEFWEHGLYDPAFAGCSAETIYQFLLDNNDQHPYMDGRGPGAVIVIGTGTAPDGAKQLPNGQYVMVYDENGNPVDLSDMSESEMPGGMTEEEFQDVLDQVRQSVDRDSSQAKPYGNSPGFQNRTIEIIQSTYRVDWRQLLLRFMTNSARSDYSWVRPNRRSHHLGVVLPGLDSHKITGVIAVDTSGSIDDTLLQVFGQEIQNIRSQVPFHELTILYCDTKIRGREVVTQGQSLEFKPIGGGGTDFRPVFETVMDSRGVPNFLIYFTDLDGSFPKSTPEFPTLWGVYNSKRCGPFGETIHLGGNP